MNESRRGHLYDALFVSLQTRPRPEDVAELILWAEGERLKPPERRILEKAAKGSLFRGLLQSASSMPGDFHRPVSAVRQVRKAAELFTEVPGVTPEDCLDPARLLPVLERIAGEIHRSSAAGDFRNQRLNRAQRAAAGLALNHRQYNKRWRFVERLRAKVDRLARELRRYDLTRVAKSALATRLTREQLERDLDSACFASYLTARLNRRSVFTNQSQDRAYDHVAEMLLARASQSPTANWFAIAHVYPDAEVLARLTPEDRGKLLGLAYQAMRDAAAMLEEAWRRTDVDLASMIVRRGNDSSTWNLAAGAWNKARDHWISLVHSLGMTPLLDEVCPGKVMRLIAADVAAWHRATRGGGIDPNTLVWAALPRPWDAVEGRAVCTRREITEACLRAAVDPAAWTGPKPPATPVPFTPTPELVHGVAVACPDLARILRKAGVWSGKLPRQNAGVVMIRAEYDEDGIIRKVDPGPESGS